MSDTPFIKFFPGDFLGGVGGLSPSERGVYITILCLIWENDGPVSLDEGRLARRCGMPKAAFLRVLKSLMDEGKVFRSPTGITNGRAEKTLVDRRNRIQNATHAANSKWNASKEKIKENQSEVDATAMQRQCVADAKPESRSQSIKKEPIGSKEKRGSRLSEDWQLTQEFILAAITLGMTEEEVHHEADRFRDYWIGKSGKDASKANWLATWRNWCRKFLDDRRTMRSTNGRRPPIDMRTFDGL